MEKFNPKRLSRILLLTLVLTGCATVPLQTPVTTITPLTSTPKPSNTKLSPTLTQPDPIWTLPATLSAQDATFKVNEILQTNGGCRLPCWWGTTPGKTSWQDASHFLESFTTIYRDGNSSYAYVYLPLLSDKGTQNHTYVIKGDTVVEIYAYVHDWSPFLYLSKFLTDYGPPDEVFIRTLRHNENGSQPYQIDLFYANLGMLLEYSGGNPNTIGDKVQNCFDDMYSPFIYIWSSDAPMTSTEAIDKFLDTQNMPYPLPLGKATGMGVAAFYEAIKKTDNVTCLETPSEFWP